MPHDGKISGMNEVEAASRKRELRENLKARREALAYDSEIAAQLNVQLAEICLANGVAKVACYLPFGNEPDTELFIDWALENSIEVLLPVSKTDGSLDWIVFNGETETGIFGFAEAVGETVKFTGVDLLIAPALAVDKNGMRLGKGKGYYDRLLAGLANVPPIAAVVFDDELVDEVPIEPHDRSVDAAVTPSQVVHFTNRLK